MGFITPHQEPLLLLECSRQVLWLGVHMLWGLCHQLSKPSIWTATTELAASSPAWAALAKPWESGSPLPASLVFVPSWALPSKQDHHPASSPAASTLLLSSFSPHLLGFFHLGFKSLFS